MAKNSYRLPLLVMAFLFFLFGFITVMNNSSIEFIQRAFGLNEVQKQLPNTFFYGAYILSIPIGFIIKRVGYKHTIFIGLALISLGFFASVGGVLLGYSGFLSTLSIFAIGVVIIQVSTAPYVVALGPAQTAASRLTFVNAMNSIATVIAPVFVSILFISPPLSPGQILSFDAIQAVFRWPYFGIGGVVALILISLLFINLPALHSQQLKEAKQTNKYKSNAFKYKHVWLGSLAIFFYLGAEIGIPSFFGDFVRSKGIQLNGNSTDMLKYYWGGLLTGRLIGIFVFQKVKPELVLLLCCIGASLFLLSAISTHGIISIGLYLGVGLFHSIMFPVVNSLALRDLGPHADVASGVINTSVVGAAVLLPMMGAIQSVSGAVTVAISCLFGYYGYIAFYGIMGAKLR